MLAWCWRCTCGVQLLRSLEKLVLWALCYFRYGTYLLAMTTVLCLSPWHVGSLCLEVVIKDRRPAPYLFRLAGPTKRLVEQRSDTSSRLWSDCFLCAELHIFPADSSLKIAANQEPSHFNKWIHLFLISLLSAWTWLTTTFSDCSVSWMMRSMLDAKCKCHIKRSMGAQKTWRTLKLCSVFCRSWILPCMVASSTSERENMVGASTQVKETTGKHDTFFVLSGTMGSQRGIEWKKKELQDRPACDKPETEKQICNFISLQKARTFKGRSTASEQETAKLAQYDGRKKMHMEPTPVF